MKLVEKIARVIEPVAWRALGTGDTLVFHKRRQSSLHKAVRVLSASIDPTEEIEASRIDTSTAVILLHWGRIIKQAALDAEKELS